MKIISAPLEKSEIKRLSAGEEVLLNGVIYTARDQAHKRLVEALVKGKKFPLELRNQVIYYCGPTKLPRGKVIGSCGPTTSSRMDGFAPFLLDAGLRGMIGKGNRSAGVVKSIKKNRAIYFLAYAGCGALISKCVLEARIVAYADLGPEAIYRLVVKDLPLIVAIDTQGRNIYG